MPIKIPDKLPATAQLRKENIFVMSEKKAMHQDIRPLKIVIVNLMRCFPARRSFLFS